MPLPRRFMRPCLECNALSRNGTWCVACDARRKSRPWYRGAWSRIARATIAASPVCWECGATEDLTADHVEPRSLRRGTVTLCRSCNSRRGGRTGREA